MYKVCAHYQGTEILLEEFECKPEAEEFMLHPYYIEYDDGGEEEIIYHDDMYLEEDSSTNVGKTEAFADLEPDDLPF